MDQFVILQFSIKPDRGVIFCGTFFWSRYRCCTRALRLVRWWWRW